MQMQEKTMVADTLAGINSELEKYGAMIAQTENKELKQTLKQFRNACEQSQEELYQIAREKAYYVPAAKATEEEVAHVKNTGRCRELLREGFRVWLEISSNPNRKTKYDLVAAEKEREDLPPLFINLDSQIPNDCAGEWLPKSNLFSEDAKIRREVTYKNSRFDFSVEEKDGRISFLEVKGVTQEINGKVLFPDAPTERGVKHLEELINCIDEGYLAYILFVVQMKGVTHLSPNDETHKAFGDTLRKAHNKGVKIMAFDSIVTPDSIVIDKEIPVIL